MSIVSMIFGVLRACDKCDEWYHDQNPKLVIKYKKKISEQELKEKFWKEINQREARERELCKQLNEKHDNSEKKFTNIDIDCETDLLDTSKRYGKNQISGEDIENFVSAIVKFGTETTVVSPVQQQDEPKKAKQNEANGESSYDDDDYRPPRKSRQGSNGDARKKKRRTGRSNKKKPLSMNIGELDDSNDEEINSHRRNNAIGVKTEPVQVPKQCLGPSCVNPARVESKYCSDECGIGLAKNRILNYLNESNVSEIVTKCEADKLNEKQLHDIEFEIESSKSKLIDLDNKMTLLESKIQSLKYAKVNDNADTDRETEEVGVEVFCVTCGHSYNEKHALKHMERCFIKYESQAFFGSFFKSHPEGQSLFCDYYNPQTKMYCKRLKSMCPEHEKEKKTNDDEVCGCPLYNKRNKFEDSNEICLLSKRNCQSHYKWERLRRAQIDLEKLRLWMKLDELYEQKRLVESAINNRSGLLACLLHKTAAH